MVGLTYWVGFASAATLGQVYATPISSGPSVQPFHLKTYVEASLRVPPWRNAADKYVNILRLPSERFAALMTLEDEPTETYVMNGTKIQTFAKRGEAMQFEPDDPSLQLYVDPPHSDAAAWFSETGFGNPGYATDGFYSSPSFGLAWNSTSNPALSLTACLGSPVSGSAAGTWVLSSRLAERDFQVRHFMVQHQCVDVHLFQLPIYEDLSRLNDGSNPGGHGRQSIQDEGDDEDDDYPDGCVSYMACYENGLCDQFCACFGNNPDQSLKRRTAAPIAPNEVTVIGEGLCPSGCQAVDDRNSVECDFFDENCTRKSYCDCLEKGSNCAAGRLCCADGCETVCDEDTKECDINSENCANQCSCNCSEDCSKRSTVQPRAVASSTQKILATDERCPCSCSFKGFTTYCICDCPNEDVLRLNSMREAEDNAWCVGIDCKVDECRYDVGVCVLNCECDDPDEISKRRGIADAEA